MSKLSVEDAFVLIYDTLEAQGLTEAYEALHVVRNEFDRMAQQIEDARRVWKRFIVETE